MTRPDFDKIAAELLETLRTFAVGPPLTAIVGPCVADVLLPPTPVDLAIRRIESGNRPPAPPTNRKQRRAMRKAKP